MIDRLVRKYRAGGMRGIREAMMVRASSGPAPSPVRIALQAVLSGEGFTIIQIGAHVGNTENDPLFSVLRKKLERSQGRLICVEPVKEHFARLVRNYAGIPNVAFEEAAIAERTGPASFYRLGVNPVEHGYPEWLTQLGSLKSERMESLWDRYEANPDYKAFYLKHRVTDVVACLTFGDLLRKHDVTKLDLLQIDTEGYELEILRTIDFARTPVRYVNYESALLMEHKPEAEALMRGHGYLLARHEQDTFCYKAGNSVGVDRRVIRRLQGAGGALIADGIRMRARTHAKA